MLCKDSCIPSCFLALVLVFLDLLLLSTMVSLLTPTKSWVDHVQLSIIKAGTIDPKGTAMKSALISQFFVAMIKHGFSLRIDQQAGTLLLNSFDLVFSTKFSINEQWP